MNKTWFCGVVLAFGLSMSGVAWSQDATNTADQDKQSATDAQSDQKSKPADADGGASGDTASVPAANNDTATDDSGQTKPDQPEESAEHIQARKKVESMNKTVEGEEKAIKAAEEQIANSTDKEQRDRWQAAVDSHRKNIDVLNEDLGSYQRDLDNTPFSNKPPAAADGQTAAQPETTSDTAK